MANNGRIEEITSDIISRLERQGVNVYYREIKANKPEFGEIEDKFINDFCTKKRIKLYSHQKEAIEEILKGNNVCISTPTSSGKTLSYHIPIIKSYLEDKNSKFLLLYPLKALAQDQREKLLKNAEVITPFFRCEIYDGDTSQHKREKIRKNIPTCLISNPDMLHFGLLPSHYKWEEFFTNLKYIVLDEVHTYRGIFGSHISWIIRRLERILNYYDAKPTYITTSATIGNAYNFHIHLFNKAFKIIKDNGAETPRKFFYFLNPLDNLSAHNVATRLFVSFIQQDIRTIVFTKARKITEIIYNNVVKAHPKYKDKVSSYRSGYLPYERREIERKLFSGDLLGVISTSALELGIDIGNLDACILVGYPGSIINTFQRAGRVGRGHEPASIFMIMQQDALDHYYAKNPEAFFEKSFEDIIIDPENIYISKKHIVCAAAELPLRLNEFGEKTEILHTMIQDGLLFEAQNGEIFFTNERNPHLKVSIRDAGDSYNIIDSKNKQIIGTVSGPRVFSECHEGAIYLHRGENYFVHRLDLAKKEILVRHDKSNYFTRPYIVKETQILKVEKEKVEKSYFLAYGKLKVTENVVGYEKKDLSNQNLIGKEELDLPPYTFETMGLIFNISQEIIKKLEDKKFHHMGSLHAIEHAMIGLLPAVVMCDRFDIGGICYTFHPQTGSSSIFIYDSYEGGAGLTLIGFEKFSKLLSITLELLKNCPCQFGCPSCIHSPKCGSQNYPLDKEGALFLLENLKNEEIHDENILKTIVIKETLKETIEIPTSGIIFFDLETKRLANEVGGWQNAHLMGLSVAVTYEEDNDKFEFYEEKDVGKLIEKLSNASLVVGYNIEDFDFRVLSGYTGKKLKIKSLDLLKCIHNKLKSRKSLQHVATLNLGLQKIADGVQAVEWFRNGEIEKLKSYCQKDVELVRDLFNLYRRQGYLNCEVNQQVVKVFF